MGAYLIEQPKRLGVGKTGFVKALGQHQQRVGVAIDRKVDRFIFVSRVPVGKFLCVQNRAGRCATNAQGNGLAFVAGFKGVVEVGGQLRQSSQLLEPPGQMVVPVPQEFRNS